MSAERTIARVFSSLFHPLILPSLGIFILLSINTYIGFSIPTTAKRIILLIVVFNTAIAPLISIMVLKKLKFIDSILLETRPERVLPLFLTGLFYLFAFFILRQAGVPFFVHFFILGATTLVFIVLLITINWKISIHMTSIGGLAGFLISVSYILKTDIPVLIIASILLSGILGYSRITIKAHSPAEVYAGFILGFIFIIVLAAFLS